MSRNSSAWFKVSNTSLLTHKSDWISPSGYSRKEGKSGALAVDEFTQ